MSNDVSFEPFQEETKYLIADSFCFRFFHHIIKTLTHWLISIQTTFWMKATVSLYDNDDSISNKGFHEIDGKWITTMKVFKLRFTEKDRKRGETKITQTFRDQTNSIQWPSEQGGAPTKKRMWNHFYWKVLMNLIVLKWLKGASPDKLGLVGKLLKRATKWA